MYRVRLFIGSLLLLIAQQGLALGAAGPDLELVCPCTYESASASSVYAGFGVLNRGANPSGELVLRAYAHREPHYFTAAGKSFLGDIPVTGSLAAGTEVAKIRRQVRLKQPAPGSYYVTFLLLEDNKIVDLTRMRDPVTFGSVAAESFSDLYFVSDPEVRVTGTEVELVLPAMGNSGSQDESVEVILAKSASADFFAGSYVTLLRLDALSAINPGTVTEENTLSFELDAPLSETDFVHLVVTDQSPLPNTLLLQTVIAPGVRWDSQEFMATSLDYLKDIDGDGVADDNERFTGTDPYTASSTPGDSTIDLLAVYSDAVAVHYNGDPSARLDHLVAVSNLALADSGIAITLRLAGVEKLAMDTSQNIYQWLSAAEKGTGLFAGLQSLRRAHGADLVAMFRRYDGLGTCGLATLGGFATQGILSPDEHISTNFIEFDKCGDITMVHEIGHNLGLGHSYRQAETGTFRWSRGHGEDNRFATIMTYAQEFGLQSELPLFSNPELRLCEDSACGVAINLEEAADAARSLNSVRFQAAAFGLSEADDSDGDGVNDVADAFAFNSAESADTDGDGLGDNSDYDDDNDSLPDDFEVAIGSDPLTADAAGDADENGRSNLEEFEAQARASQYLQTTSNGQNISRLHIVNTSSKAQVFVGTLYDSSGRKLGASDQVLGQSIEPRARLVLTSDDIETLLEIEPWSGPAMLEVTGSDTFSLMAKLVSPSGLVSNTNCVRRERVLNVEGFDSENLTFVRFINTGHNLIGTVTGTLYDASGNPIGVAGAELVDGLMPKQQVWLNRDQLAERIGAEWEGEAMLEVSSTSNLRLLNLNFVNGETFFNFSCFENETSGIVYLQTTSTSPNLSTTHIVNTSGVAQTYRGTLYASSGQQLGDAEQILGTVPNRGRLVFTSDELEQQFGVSAWRGPAMLHVTAEGEFELMTKLLSPSGLTSNTNCVREGQVHNIEGVDSPDKTFVRFINTGSSSLGAVTANLFDASGGLIGKEEVVLFDEMAPRQQSWKTRDDLVDLFGESWVGEAMLEVSAGSDLRMLNLNYINSETFFNFSCYEESGEGP